jgi:hypothetical protein
MVEHARRADMPADEAPQTADPLLATQVAKQ